MLSAPHMIPPMIVVSLPAGLTAPDFTRVDGGPRARRSTAKDRICSASSSTGANPAADTRYCSSKTADPVVNYRMIALKMPSRTLDKIDFNTRIVPGQKAFSASHADHITGPSMKSG